MSTKLNNWIHTLFEVRVVLDDEYYNYNLLYYRDLANDVQSIIEELEKELSEQKKEE